MDWPGKERGERLPVFEEIEQKGQDEQDAAQQKDDLSMALSLADTKLKRKIQADENIRSAWINRMTDKQRTMYLLARLSLNEGERNYGRRSQDELEALWERYFPKKNYLPYTGPLHENLGRV